MGVSFPKCFPSSDCCPKDNDKTLVDKAINYKLNILNLNVKLKDNNLIQNINSIQKTSKKSEAKDGTETMRLIVNLQRKIRSFLSYKKRERKSCHTNIVNTIHKDKITFGSNTIFHEFDKSYNNKNEALNCISVSNNNLTSLTFANQNPNSPVSKGTLNKYYKPNEKEEAQTFTFYKQKNFDAFLKKEDDQETFDIEKGKFNIKTVGFNSSSYLKQVQTIPEDGGSGARKINIKIPSVQFEEMEEDFNEEDTKDEEVNRKEDLEYFLNSSHELSDNSREPFNSKITENKGEIITKLTNNNNFPFSHKVSFNLSKPDFPALPSAHSPCLNETLPIASKKPQKVPSQLRKKATALNNSMSSSFEERAGDLEIDEINEKSSQNSNFAPRGKFGKNATLMRTFTKVDMDFGQTKGHFLMVNKNVKYKYFGNKDSSNKKTGYGQIIWENYSSLKGFFSHSKLNGMAEFGFGNSIYQGEYVDNVPKGYGFFRKGKYYLESSSWYRNYLNRIGVCIWEDGDIYEGEFVNTKKHGIGTYYFPDGTMYKGEWNEDKMEGFGIMKYKNENT